MIDINDLKCLYKVQAEKRLARGDTSKHFDDVDCFYCTEPYSAILCRHYINKKHLEDFKRLELRT